MKFIMHLRYLFTVLWNFLALKSIIWCEAHFPVDLIDSIISFQQEMDGVPGPLVQGSSFKLK